MSALTRILNNQIYNATIVASQKIQPGSIVGSLFASNVTIPGDLLISGNLSVLGSSAVTTVASTNTYVNDPLIVLNNGFSGTNTYDEGFVFNRGTSTNQAFIWSETYKEFRLIATAETGTTYGNVNATGLAPLSIGSLNVGGFANVGGINITGAITGANLNVTGNILSSTSIAQLHTGSTATFGNVAAVTVGNVGTQFNGAAINISGNILSAGAVHNSLTVNGNQSINSGYLNVQGNILGQSATFNSALVNGNGTFTGYLNVSGNILSASLITTTINASGNVLLGLTQAAAINATPIGNITTSTGAFTTLTSSGITTVTNATQATAFGTGAFQVTGGASIGGNLWVGGNLNVIGNSFTISGNIGVFYGNAVGAGALYAGVIGYTPQPYTTIQSTGNANNFIQINNQNLNAGSNASSDFVATMDTGNTTQGYIDMGINSSGFTGGAGSELNYPGDGYLYVFGNAVTGSGNLLLSTSLANDIVFSLNGQGASNEIARFNYAQNALLIKSATASTNTTSGALQVIGGAGIGGRLYVGQGIQNTAIGNVTPSTAVFTYAIAGNIESGFIGNTGTAFTGASLNVTGNISTALINAGQINTTGNILATAGTFNSVTVNGNQTINSGYLNVQGNILGQTGTLSTLILNSSTNSTQSTGTGALQVTGGASFGQDVFVQGNIYAANIIGTGYQYLAVQDPLLYLQGNVVYPYNYDLGFYSHFIGGSGNTYQHTGMIRDNADGYWKIFSNVPEPAGGQVDFTNAIYDGVKAGNLVLTNPVASTSTTTGALQVAGGAGIQGTLVAGQINSAGNVLGTSGTFQSLTVNGNEIVTGYLDVTGNVLTAQLNAGQINTTGNVLATGAIFNSVTVNGNQTINSGYLNVQGNVLGQTATFNTLVVNGNETISGYINAAGNILTPQLNAGQINTTGNLLAVGIVAATLSTSGNIIGGLAEFAAINATPVGNATASTGAFTTLSASASFYANATTSSNTSTSGSIVTAGAIGAAGNITTAGILGVVQNGVNAFTSIHTSVLGYFAGNTNNSVQVAVQNFGQGNIASTDFALYNNIGTDTNNYLDIGILGSGYDVNGQGFTVASPGDGYMYSNIANLVIGTDTVGKTISFFTGGYLNTNIRANITDSGITVNTATTSNSYSSGALVVNGGVGIAGNLVIKSNTRIALGLDLNNNLYLEDVVQITAVSNSSQRISIQNISNGNLATSEFAAMADTGSDSNNLHLVGITGSNYLNNSNVPIIKPIDSYSLGIGGNLILAATKDVVISANSFTTVGIRVSANNTNVGIQYSTVATSPTTGALTVNGGVGINSNLWIANGAVINNSQTSDNFTVKGATSTALIYANSNLGAVVVGGSGPGASGGNTTIQPGATFKVDSHDSMLLPVGTTAQRPSNSGNVDVQGMMRFNSTVNNVEFFDGSAWQATGSSFTVISDRQFSGNTGYGNVDGTNTTYTIQANSTTSSTIVSINGVMQFPTLAYSVSGATLTFTEPPAPGDVIDVRVLATTTVVSTLASGNGLNQFIADNTGSSIWTGTSGTTERVLVDPVGNMNFLTGNKVTYNQTPVNIPLANTPVQVDTWSQTAYTTAKYLITSKVGTTNFETYEAHVLTDGNGNAFVSVYGIVNNGTSVGTISANVISGNVNIYYTSTIAQANVKAMGTFIV